jgi:hypothetical protein
MCKLAHVTKYALMASQEFEIAKLTFWFSCLRQLSNMELGQLEVFKIFVHKTIPQIFFVSALPSCIVGLNDLVQMAAV